MTRVEVIVGHGTRDDTHRKAARAWVIDRYQRHQYPVRVGAAKGRWCKANAYNPAAALSDAEVLVIADADSVVTRGALATAISHATRDGYAVPAQNVRRLTPAATQQLLATDPTDDPDTRLPIEGGHQLLAGGGIVVVTSELWRAVGGFDPRFIGWGGEDYALGCALYALTGLYPARSPGVLWHLWHPPQTRDQRLTPANEALSRRYLNAKHDRPAMRALLAEVSSDDAT